MNSPIKWMGSKKKLVPWLEEYIPKYNRIIEPFMGSGIVMFSQEPENALCADLQEEPILIANAIKQEPAKFFELFTKYSDDLWNNGESYYYHLRQVYNTEKDEIADVNKAAMFMVLLRAGFNGIIRFNPKGYWNVPFGDRGWHGSKKQAIKLTNSFSIDKIMEWSKFLNTGNKQFKKQSFEETIREAGEGDFIYCDPPYLITTQQYKIWNQELENQLAQELRNASDRGAKFMLSNVYTYKDETNDALLELYKGFEHKKKSHNYVVGPKQARRQSVEEIIIFN